MVAIGEPAVALPGVRVRMPLSLLTVRGLGAAVLMHAIDLFRGPRPESVRTSAELATITTATIFILGSDDPYLAIERARPSIDQIHGGRLYEVPGGHAPWLVDAQHAAELIAAHLHLASGPHLTPAPGGRRPANAPA